LEQFQADLGNVKPSGFGTCWFHLTRAQESATFSQGLLPLNLSVDAVWQYLESLADSGCTVDFREFRARLGKQPGHYGSRVTSAFHWGPYGVLVRDVAFRGDFGSDHFFDAPEIVVDICSSLRDEYGIDLLDRFVRTTKPCIVKFWHDIQNPKALSTALYYLYCMEHGGDPGFYTLLDFDGQGRVVAADRIVKVEFPDVRANSGAA
jgi:hypothetical protein